MHVVDDGAFAADLEQTLNVLVESGRAKGRSPSRIVYRGTQCNIFGCLGLPDPLSQEEAKKRRWSPPAYRWRAIPHQNELARKIARRAGVTFMDVWEQTKVRPGGHRRSDDCVHYCLPGPVDAWSQLLLAFLTL